MDGTVLGQVANRPVRAPPDAQAWMRSVIGGLQNWGIPVEFTDSTAEAPGVINTEITLKSAWVASATTAKTANVVLRVEFQQSTTAGQGTDYRGHISSVNWNSNDGELQAMVNRAFDEALSQIAADFRTRCVSTGGGGGSR